MRILGKIIKQVHKAVSASKIPAWKNLQVMNLQIGHFLSNVRMKLLNFVPKSPIFKLLTVFKVSRKNGVNQRLNTFNLFNSY